MVGIQAIFRHLRPDTPTQLFDKLMHKTDHQPERRRFLTLVEWMHDDAMDARNDLFASHIWDFPDGPGNPGQLKEDCKEWGMFLSLPDLDRPECDRQPGRYFDFWKFLWRMCKVHEGSVRLVGPQDDWEHRDGPPPWKRISGIASTPQMIGSGTDKKSVNAVGTPGQRNRAKCFGLTIPNCGQRNC